MVYNGKGTCEWVSKGDAASPTAYVEIIMIARVLDAKEDRDVMTGEVQNSFIQVNIPKIKQAEDRVMMKFTGLLVDKLVQLAPWPMCIKSAQHRVAFHVNDLKSSHKDPKVNDDFEKWLEQTYGKQGKVKIKQCKFH